MEEDACAASPSLRRSAAVAVTAAASTGSSAASTKAGAQPVRALREDHAQRVVGGQPGPGARAGHQGARGLVLEEVPERHDQAEVLRLQQLHQGHQARAQQRQRAGRRRGQPGLPDRLRAGQGEADPAARHLRREVRLGQAILAPARRSSSAGRPTARPSARATSGASPSSGSRSACSTTRRCSRSTAAIRTPCRRRSPASDKLLATLRTNAPADVPIINIGNKDGYRGAPRLRHGAGRVRERPVRAQLDLPRPGQHLRVAGQPQGDDAVPAVVQGQLLRPETTTLSARTTPLPHSRRATACSISAATGRPRSSSPASRTTPGS